MTRARILADYVAGGTTASEFDVLDGLTSTTAELNYVDGVTSNVQTQLDNKPSMNMIINGGMEVWQRSTDITASDGSNEGYNSIDRWYFNFNSSCPGTLDIDKSTDAPSGFGSSMRLKCNATGTPAGSSTDFVMASISLEAQDLQRLCYGSADAKVTTLSWYMKSVNFTTPISVSIETFDGTREFYHVNVSPTTSWARYSITIPKSTSATISNDTGAGLLIGFVLSGSTDGSLAEANDSSAWSTTQKTFRTNQTNFFASTSNELYITGLQFELGSSATPFEHRTYADELRRCQRYYEKSASDGGSIAYATGTMSKSTQGTVFTNAFFNEPKRATPTVNVYSQVGVENEAKFDNWGVGNTGIIANFGASWISKRKVTFFCTNATTTHQPWNLVFIDWKATAEM